MSTPNAAYWHAINTIIPGNLYKLLPICKKIGGPKTVFTTHINKLINLGLPPSLANKLYLQINKLHIIQIWEEFAKYNIQTLTYDQPNFPKQLSQIPDAPPLLYIRGQLNAINNPGLAVVGSRKITNYGSEVIKLLVPQIVTYGQAVISGMAIGVDATALKTCIDSQGIPIGVLASSLADSEIAPKENFQLAQQIIKHGCLISENPPGVPTYKLHFPLRNRIVSGLSQGLLIIEAALNSGSLVTAKLALEQNKDIFAVPGSIFSATSSGTLTLIKQGAKCVTTIQDLAEELNWQKNSLPLNLTNNNGNPTTINLTDIQQQIIHIIHNNPTTVDQLIAQLQLPPATILWELTQLELLGFLRQTSNGVYHKAR